MSTFGADREEGCCGYQIQYTNNPTHPGWLIMRWSDILAVCPTLTDACEWLRDYLKLEE